MNNTPPKLPDHLILKGHTPHTPRYDHNEAAPLLLAVPFVLNATAIALLGLVGGLPVAALGAAASFVWFGVSPRSWGAVFCDWPWAAYDRLRS